MIKVNVVKANGNVRTIQIEAPFVVVEGPSRSAILSEGRPNYIFDLDGNFIGRGYDRYNPLDTLAETKGKDDALPS